MFRSKEDTSNLACFNAAAGLAMTTSSFEVDFRLHNYPEANVPRRANVVTVSKCQQAIGGLARSCSFNRLLHYPSSGVMMQLHFAGRWAKKRQAPVEGGRPACW
jgi:hypothetical protein